MLKKCLSAMGVKMFCFQAIDYTIYQRYNKAKQPIFLYKLYSKYY